MADMHCANQKSTKLLKELETKAGLIERQKQGQGKPTRIYVKDFATGLHGDGDGKMIVFELSDDKFIFNLCNFEKFPEFEMNDIFDVMEKNYSLVTGIHGNKGSFHEHFVMTRMFKGMK